MKTQRAKRRGQVTAGQLTVLSMALMAALAAMAPSPAAAQAVTIGSGTLTDYWTSGDQVISGIISSTSATGVQAFGPSLGTLTNNGSIAPGFNNAGANSSITALINNGAITQSSGTALTNFGTIGTLTNNGSIVGGNNAIENSNLLTMLTNNGLINSSNIGISNDGAKNIDSLINGGTISGTNKGISNLGTIGTLSNTSIAGTIGTISGKTGLLNRGSITSLENAGVIAGTSQAGINNFSGGTIATITNDGTISSIPAHGSAGASNAAIMNNGATIGTLSNNGLINGGWYGISNNSASIGNLKNDGTIQGGTTGILNSSATITSLVNNGLISGGGIGIAHGLGAIDTLTNNGTISGAATAVQINTGSSIGALSNTGTIVSSPSGTSVGIGIFNLGTMTSLDNSGAISAGKSGISNSGAIGTLSNSGVISANGNAINNTAGGTLGTIVNSGAIVGAVRNLATADLTLIGGTGTISGTFTGVAGAIGTITNQSANLIFASGNVLLNDSVKLGANTMFNTAAALQVNNAITITGNYRQNINASLIIGVGDNAIANGTIATDSGYGRLAVSGTATIDSGSTIVLKKLNSYSFAQGQRFVVVQAAASGTNYNAGLLNYSASGFNGTVTGSSVVDSANHNRTDLVLTLTAAPTPPNSGGGTPPGSGGGSAPINSATNANAFAALAGLFKYGGTDFDLMNLFNAAAAAGASNEADRAGAQLSPGATVYANNQALQALTRDISNVVSSRLNNLQLSRSGDGGGVSTGESTRDPAMWTQGFGGHSNQNQRDGVSGYRADFSGLLIGADAMANDNWRVGGLLNYANTSVHNKDANEGSSARIDSYGLTGYAGYSGKPWYVNMSLGAARHRFDSSRAIAFTGFSGTADGSYGGLQYTAAAQAGYPIALGSDTTVTPLAGLNYSTIRQDGYTESGGNGAALHVDAVNSQSLKSELGVKLERSIKMPYGALLPSMQLGWRHEYRDTRLQSTAGFTADNSGATNFVSNGPNTIANTGALSLGVTLMRGENLALTARYVLESGGGYTAQTGDLLLRWRF